MNIFVGNLSKDVTDNDLLTIFSEHGNVKSVKVIRDMFSGESKGFGFIEMPGQAESLKAIKEVNTFELKGKKLVVNEARPKTANNRSGGSNGNRNSLNRNSGGGGGGGRRSW